MEDGAVCIHRLASLRTEPNTTGAYLASNGFLHSGNFDTPDFALRTMCLSNCRLTSDSCLSVVFAWDVGMHQFSQCPATHPDSHARLGLCGPLALHKSRVAPA